MALDLDGAMARLGNDVSLFQEFIGFYQEDYPRLVQNLKSAVESKDPESVHHAAHGLKGLVASLGATEVAALAGSLERSGRARDLSEADALLGKLLAEIDHLNSELAQFRKSGKSEPARKK